MPKFSSITKQHPVSVTFALEDESLTISFDRNRITQRWLNNIAKGMVDDDASSIARLVLEVLLAWDVQDEHGNQLEPSVDLLEQLPLTAFMKLTEAISKAAVPASEEGEVSSEGLSRPVSASTETSPPLQNGPQPSPSPAPSASQSPT